LLGIQEEETASAEHPRPLAPTKHPPVATTTNKQTMRHQQAKWTGLRNMALMILTEKGS
jgi:hypothetical protein